MNNRKTPIIRFKGFTDDWEQRKLGELVDRVVRKNTNNESTLPLTISAQYGLVNQILYFNNRVASRDVSNYYLVLNGEFAYNKSTSDGYPFGAVKRLDLYEKGVLSTLYIVFAPKEDHQIDSDFLTVFFDTDRWYKGVAERASEGARNHGLLNISAENFFDIDLSMPEDIAEQKQIGAIIRNLDHLITLHQRKLEKLKIVKKAMLENCFPKNGEKVPRFRFSGFTGDWEQRKLGEMLISLQNNTLSRAELSPEQGIAKNVHYGDILVKFGEIIDVKTESLPMIADEAIMAKYKSSFLQNGDVIVADTAEDETVGKCTEIVGLSDEIVISGLHTIPYRPLQKFASGYLGYYMNSAFFHNQLLPLMQGIKVTSISKTALQNTDISYPKSENEQAAIGKYFSRLDHLITLHQRKLEKLKIIKKSFLEKMFV